jgi:hypothetical protein
MSQGNQPGRVINLYPVRFPDGEVRFTGWPDATASLVFDLGSKLITSKRGQFVLLAVCLGSFLIACSESRRRRW